MALDHMRKEMAQIKPLPDAVQDSHYDYSKDGAASIINHYVSEREYPEVMEYYHKEFTR